MSPLLLSALVAVVSWKEVPAPEVPAMPQVPTEAIAIQAQYYSELELIVEKVCRWVSCGSVRTRRSRLRR